MTHLKLQICFRGKFSEAMATLQGGVLFQSGESSSIGHTRRPACCKIQFYILIFKPLPGQFPRSVLLFIPDSVFKTVHMARYKFEYFTFCLRFTNAAYAANVIRTTPK